VERVGTICQVWPDQEVRSAPMIHRLSPWTPLISAPEAVEGRFLGSVSPDTRMDRCGPPTFVPCDAPPSLRDA
jgi:hypothetical protein